MSPRDLHAWMWSEACNALARAERLQREFFRVGSAAAPGWEPPVDLFETPEELWILAALPGVEANQVEIAIVDDVLRIAGIRATPAAQRRAVVHRLEIPQGRFERRIALPPGRFEIGRRDIANGCLTLTLRKLA
jgi:HSP20 family protein